MFLGKNRFLAILTPLDGRCPSFDSLPLSLIRLGGKFSAAISNAGVVPCITSRLAEREISKDRFTQGLIERPLRARLLFV